ncbi:MAG TPA: antibiotic biosynthesis monooxygenase [Actinomycetota bacterium]|nr:antibiotic biosynthesis monooxygenase [Actinomycetota bacterium]
MSEPLIFVDVSEILPEKLEEAKSAFKELAAFVEANEPGTISYNVFFNTTETVVTVVQVHPDSASMEFHVKVGADLFRKFAGLLTMRRMEIYGEQSASLLEAMQAKAKMLGAPGVEVHNLHAGFTRLDNP